jgi:hypothetical protein
MEKRSEISLGDLLVAFERLQPRDAASRDLLIRMLVLGPRQPATDSDGERKSDRGVLSLAQAGDLSLFGLDTMVWAQELTETRAKDLQSESNYIPFTLQHTGRVAPTPAALGSKIQMLERASSALPVMPQPSPLFVSVWQAGIIAAALGVPRPEGPLDTEKTVPLLARRLPVRSFPRRQVHSMRLGVRVLADVSESMIPFAQDREQLIGRVRTVLGSDRTEVHHFTGVPLRGVRSSPRSTLRSFAPPPHGTPLLVLSDLGLGEWALDAERADVSEWLEFESMARRAGCRVVVLVPYSPRRWPRALRRQRGFLHWDRRTTARAVLQALQR